jgi:hypothetical protein
MRKTRSQFCYSAFFLFAARRLWRTLAHRCCSNSTELAALRRRARPLTASSFDHHVEQGRRGHAKVA